MAIVCLFSLWFVCCQVCFSLSWPFVLFFWKEKRLSFYILLGTVFYFPCSTSAPPPPTPGTLPHITPARKLKNACPVQPDDIPCPCVRIAPASTKDPRNPVETRFGVNRIGGVGGRGREGRKEMDRVYLQDK
jgi:hypothetical protein